MNYIVHNVLVTPFVVLRIVLTLFLMIFVKIGQGAEWLIDYVVFRIPAYRRRGEKFVDFGD